MKQQKPEQLNIFVPAEPQEEYSLESIIAEFSDAPIAPKDTAVFSPVRLSPEEEIFSAAEASVRKITEDRFGVPVADSPVVPKPKAPAAPKKVEAPKPPKPVASDKPLPKRAEKPPKPPRKEAQTAEKKPHPTIAVVESNPSKTRKAAEPKERVTPQALCKKYERFLPLAHVRCALLGLLTLLMLLPVFFGELLSLPSVFFDRYFCLGTAIVSLLMAADVLRRGLMDSIRLRFGLYSLTVLLAALLLIDGFLSADAGYTALMPLLLYLSCRALLHERLGTLHTLRTVEGFSKPVGIFEVPKLLKNANGLRRADGDMDDYLRHLSAPDLPGTVLRVYSLFLLPLSAVMAYLLSLRSELDFPRIWMLLLSGGIPFSGALCYTRPFAMISKRLKKCGGALCGWYSARLFAKRHTVILRDEDLFPSGNVASNGMKLYGSLGAPRVIAYALAALDAAENPLSDIFEELLHAQYGRHYTADAFRIYDVGGIGAEVAGDVVLVGSLTFIRSMGVHMPDGAKVRQAVYVSVNGELAGIFALKYKPSAAARNGLRDILSKRNIRVLLGTRDFLLTPDLIAAKYELSAEALVCPSYGERLRLSEADPEKAALQGGLIAGDSFGAFASTVAAGRSLRSAALLSLWLSLLSGLLGLCICILLILWNAPASVLHIAAFQLLWSILTAFVTWIAVHF